MPLTLADYKAHYDKVIEIALKRPRYRYNDETIANLLQLLLTDYQQVNNAIFKGLVKGLQSDDPIIVSLTRFAIHLGILNLQDYEDVKAVIKRFCEVQATQLTELKLFGAGAGPDEAAINSRNVVFSGLNLMDLEERDWNALRGAMAESMALKMSFEDSGIDEFGDDEFDELTDVIGSNLWIGEVSGLGEELPEKLVELLEETKRGGKATLPQLKTLVDLVVVEEVAAPVEEKLVEPAVAVEAPVPAEEPVIRPVVVQPLLMQEAHPLIRMGSFDRLIQAAIESDAVESMVTVSNGKKRALESEDSLAVLSHQAAYHLLGVKGLFSSSKQAVVAKGSDRSDDKRQRRSLTSGGK